MTFPPQFLDEIRTRVPLEGVIGKRVRLARRGRELLGLCPFHKEKTPSFTVNEDKGFFHCFGCGAHGDVIGFVMRDEGLSFPEAVERLAGDAGLALPARDPRAAAREKQRLSLFEVVEAAAKWFEAELAGPRGAQARRYLEGRGVDEATRATFRLGYAPDSRTALRTRLEKDGVTQAMLLEAGLVIAPDDGRAPYDRFRGRLIFPICDRRGRVVAFGGRALGDGQPKYLNSPETPLFAKGSLLYGQHLAAPAARKAGQAIAVEGYMDVIALHQVGIAQAVAPLGTALTEQQLEGLWRLADDPVLCFDGDEAGKRAAGRAVERALPLLNAGRSLRFALLPEGQDPDAMVRDSGHRAMVRIIDAANSLFQQLGRMASGGHALDAPEARVRTYKRFLDLTSRIPEHDLRRDYRNEFREQLWPSSQEHRYGSRAERNALETRVSPSAVHGPDGGGTPQPREGALLTIVMGFPELLIEQRGVVADFPFNTPRLAQLAAAMVHWAEEGREPDGVELRHALEQRGLGGVLDELAEGNTRYRHGRASVEGARELFEDVLRRQHHLSEERETQAEAEGAHIDEERWNEYRESILRKREDVKADMVLPDSDTAPRVGSR